MANRKMHGMWVLYLLPPFAFVTFLFWLAMDVWHGL
jgi:hypothetical protein